MLDLFFCREYFSFAIFTSSVSIAELFLFLHFDLGFMAPDVWRFGGRWEVATPPRQAFGAGSNGL